jgi:hypothetical protein
MMTVSIRAVIGKGIEEETCTKKRGGEFTAKKVVAVVVTTGMSSM